MKLLFASISLLQVKRHFDPAQWHECPIPCLTCRQHCRFHQRFGEFGSEIVKIASHTGNRWQPCSRVFWRALAQ